MQPLFEYIPARTKPLDHLVEGTGDTRFLCLKGLFIQGEARNHNGRIYPRSEIEVAVGALTERITEGSTVYGELDHPEGLNVSLKDASHIITEMRMVGNDGHGTMRIVPAGHGLIVKGLIDIGAQLGVSSRGEGSVNESTGMVSGFRIVTIDIVANPSAPNALPRALRESLEGHYTGREAMRLAEAVKDDRTAQRHFEKAFADFATAIRDELVWRTRT